jgi:hypothetical protein
MADHTMKRPKSSSTHTYSLGSLPYLFLFVGAKILKRYAKTRHRLEKFLTATPQHRNFWFFIYSHPSTLNVIPSFVLLGITNNERMCGVTSF